MEGESQTHRESLHGDELTTGVTCNIARLRNDGISDEGVITG
jgi:hypothetical protein